jgi:peptide/nickel transport system substrate-binding protein
MPPTAGPVAALLAALASGLVLAILPGAEARTPPDVLVVGQVAEPRSLDPHAVTATNDFRILVNLYEGLVRYRDGTLEVEPALAESWTVNDAGTEYAFTLRRGVRFHDGSALDAEAVKFNFERMLDGDHPFHHTGPFPLSFFFDAVEEVRAPDPHTVEFTLSEPYAPFLSHLAYPTGLIVSPTAVRSHAEAFGRNPSGTGPFRFVEWRSNTRVVIERNDEYWGTPPALRAVVFRPIRDANTRVAEMLSGGIDLMVEVPPDNLALFRDDPAFEVHEAAGPHLWFLILNTREGPLADQRVRQAVNYAIDKRALVEDVLQGAATIASGPIPPAFAWAHDDTLEPYPHDPDRARALVQEAGHAGASLTFYVAEGGSGMLDPIPMGTAIQADLARVGLEVRIETYEWNTFLARVNPGLAGQADMAQMAWMTNDPDTLPYLALRTEAWPERGGFNSGYYSNPEVDALLEEARRTSDRDERARRYHRVHALVREDAPWAFIAHWKQSAAASSRVEGLRLQPSFFLHLHGVSKR